MRHAFLLFQLLASSALAQSSREPVLIPKPAELRWGTGTLDLGCPWQVEVGHSASVELFELLQADLAPLQPPGQKECLVPVRMEFRMVEMDTVLPPEWYRLEVRLDGITITAPSEAGLYRGSRTLVQLLEGGRVPATLPCLTITDWPRFGWRGMHLDVCRHFFPVDFVKKYIDLIARYKMNTFHWHLTEDQGWRFEIKKHPRLTEVGAWRRGSQVGPYVRQQFDSVPYGGLYTQAQIREVVAYAAARHITVVPEIEMPGHAMAALASYPQLGCTGGPYEVQRGWGVFEDVFCAGNDSVFAFLEDVLAEAMDLFPGEYIHIGGDECPKERWKHCVKCQRRMKDEGLKDEHELQSWFIRRIEKFVNSKGRKIIGWDEILEGGLAPNAAVMSWRGTEGGIAAAKQKHNVVMCPGSHCYFDHYQGDPANEPLAIGGHTTVQKVYSYDPIPTELKPEEHQYILGAQGNVWTEYILTPDHVEYMAVPRMLALAEVLWSPKDKRDEADFLHRLAAEFPRLEAMKVNASKSLYQARIRLSPSGTPGEILAIASCSAPGTRPMIGWSRNDPGNGLVRSEREDMLRLRSSTLLHASTLDQHGQELARTECAVHFNLATARPITLSVPPHERYSEGGAFTLVDGITAQEKRVSTEWLGWKESVTITVDLGSVQEIGRISIGALNETHSWIHLPERVGISVSNDGKAFTPFGSAEVNARAGRNSFAIEKAGQARYVRLAVKHSGRIPEGFPGAGHPAWLFLDDIEVR